MFARLLLMFSLLWAVAASAQTAYSDPAGNYRLAVPAGWQVQPQGGGVSLLSGPAYASLIIVSGRGSPKGLVEAMAQNFLGQWRSFQGASTGDTRFAGNNGAYSWFTGVNPKGVESVLKIVATTDGEQGYALIYSAPRSTFGSRKADLESVEASIELLHGRK